MIGLLLVVLGWVLMGAIGLYWGMTIDKNLYTVVKMEWWIVGLSLFLGPIVLLVCLRALWDHFLYMRKKNRG